MTDFIIGREYKASNHSEVMTCEYITNEPNSNAVLVFTDGAAVVRPQGTAHDFILVPLKREQTFVSFIYTWKGGASHVSFCMVTKDIFEKDWENSENITIVAKAYNTFTWEESKNDTN